MERALFYDELGNPIEFVIKAKFSIEETDYVAMLPAETIDPYVYILKIVLDEEGQEMLAGIDDEELDEATKVYEELSKEKLQ
ncbi:MAG: DUF1292 domain-containing protein [Tissierellia bacterium]|nr:DUF1292 domain-containing protein [Tissierellia bacterium]